MHKIQLLDCSLRDGGYVNEWNFGIEVIQKTISSLVKANIDIVELGFLKKSLNYNKNVTLFSTIEQAYNLINLNESKTTYVVMVNHGEFDVNSLPKSNNSIGIRYAFHKQDFHKAMEQLKQIHTKGYELFVQPMVINSYSSNEINDLINSVNELMPHALYIVDSFGVLLPKEVIYYANIFEARVNDSITIGFHSHNNKQLSVANSIVFIDEMSRNIIVDSSIYGMGRGAGNLNTEIMLDYINNHFEEQKYDGLRLLSIIDEYYYPKQLEHQ